jgi:hypothetical protein
MKQSASVALVTALLALSCKDSTTSPKFGSPTNIASSWAIIDVGVAGEETPTRPSVRITDAENRPVPGVTVTYYEVSGGGTLEGRQQVTNEFGVATLGRWILGRNFGVNHIVAQSPNLPLIEFKVRGIAPDAGVVAFDFADPAGDTAARPVGGHPAVDILRVRGDFKRDSLILTLTFASPVVAGTADAVNSIGGSIELDTDDNALTGYKPPELNFYGGTAVLGVDYVYDLFNSGSTRILLFNRFGWTRALISYPGNSVVIRTPLSMLGDDDGNFSLAVNLGPYVWASDFFPNTGQLVVRRDGSGASIVTSKSVMALSKSQTTYPDWKPARPSGW